MKKVRKILFMTFGLLMICLTLLLVNQKGDELPSNNSIGDKVSTTTEPTYVDLSAYNLYGGLKTIFTAEPLYETNDNPVYIQNLSDVEAEADGSKIVYISFYYESVNGTCGFQYVFDFASSGVTYSILDIDAEISAGKTKASEEMSAAMAGGADFTTVFAAYNAKVAKLDAIPNTYLSKFYDYPSFTLTSGKLMVRASNSTQVVGTNALAGKVKLVIPAGVDSIDVTCTEFAPDQGEDNKSGATGSVSNPEILEKLSISLGAGEKSKSTITTGTWTGGSGYDTVDFVADHDAHTLTATIPAEWPTSTITYSFKTEKGSNTLSGGGVDTTNKTIPVPAKGGKVEVDLVAKAEDETEQAYKVIVERRSVDITGFTLYAGTESYDKSLFNYDSDSYTYTLASPNILGATNTTSKFKVTLSGSTANYSIDTGSQVASGAEVEYALGNKSTTATPYTVNLNVTEYGYTHTYVVKFNRANASNELGITSLTVKNGSTPLEVLDPVTGPSVITYELKNPITFDVSSLTFTVTLKESVQTISVGGTIWNNSDTVAQTIDTTGSDNGTDGYDFYKEFVVTSQYGDTQTYKILGTREYKKNNTTVITGTWKGNASTKAVTLSKSGTTFEAVIPANFTSTSMTFEFTNTDSGTNSIADTNYVTSDAVGASTRSYQLSTLPTPGNTVSTTVVSKAQDGTPTNYTLKITRRASDFSNVTIKGNKSGSSYTFTADQYDSTNKTYTLPADNILNWDNTMAEITITLADTSKQTLTYDSGVSGISGSAYKYSINSGDLSTSEESCTVDFEVKEVDGSATTYTIAFKRAAGSGNVSIDNIIVWTDSETSPLTLEGPDSNNIYTIKEDIPYEKTTIYFKVVLNDKNKQSITYGSVTGWDGTSYKEISTGSTGNTTNYPFQATFTVVPQVGSGQNYTIKGEREFKKANSTTTTGTWEGNDASQAVNFGVNHTTRELTGTIPAYFTSTYITVDLTTAGGGSNTITGITGDWNTSGTPITVKTPALGQSVTAKVEAVAQDNVTKVEYTLTLTRREFDYSGLTFVSKDADGNVLQTLSLTEDQYDSTSSTYTLPIDSGSVVKLPWNATKVDLSLTLVSTSTQTLKINGGTSKSVNIGNPSNAETNHKITVTITENGDTETFYIEFDRNAGDDSTALVDPFVKVWLDNDANPYNINKTTNSSGQTVFEIIEDIDYNDIELNFVAYLKDAEKQHIVYGTKNDWDGEDAQKLSTGSLGNSSPYAFAVSFKVYSQLGNSETYVITGTRLAAFNNNELDTTIHGVTLREDNTYLKEQFDETAGVEQLTIYTYNKVIDDTKVRFELSCHESSTLLFGAGDVKAAELWTEADHLYSSIPLTTEYEVGANGSPKQYTAVVITDTGVRWYHTFLLQQPDNRSKNTQLQALTLTIGATPLVPQVSSTDATATTFNKDTYVYYYKVPYKYEGTNTITVTATPVDLGKATVLKAGSVTADAATTSFSVLDLAEKSSGLNNEFYYYVKSEADTFGTPYKVVVIREDGREDANISNIKVVSGSTTINVPNASDASGLVYDAVVPIGSTTADISFDYSAGATVSPSSPQNVTLVDGKGQITVSVTPEKGPVKTYTINVYAAEQGADVTKIRILDYDKSYDEVNAKLNSVLYDLVNKDGDLVYDFNANDYTSTIKITVPYAVDKIYMHAISTTKPNAVFVGTGVVNLVEGSPKTVTVYSKSHYSTINTSVTEESNKYVFEITREKGSEENRIDSFAAYYTLVPSNSTAIDAANIDFNSDLPGISISNFDLDNYTQATLYVKLKEPVKSKLTVDGNEITPDSSQMCIVPLSSLVFNADGKATVNLVVTPEKGSPRTYVLTISSGAKVDPVMPTITGISINGPKANKDYLQGITLNPTNPISITLDKNETNVTVVVAISGTEGSYTVEYTEVDKPMASQSGTTVSVPTAVGTTIIKVYPFTTKEKGTVYTFELNRTKPSDVDTLNDVTINGEAGVPSASGDYQFDVPSGTTSVPVSITPTDVKSTVTITLPDGTTFTPTNVDTTTGEITGNIPGLTPGANNITISVKPEDDSKPVKQYNVTVNVDQPTTLKSIIVKSMDESTTYATLAGTTTEHSVNVPYNVDYVKVIYELQDGVIANQYSVTGAGLSTNPYSLGVPASLEHSVVVSTIAGASATTTYKIDFVKQTPSVDNKLLTVNITLPDNNGDGTAEVLTIDGFDPDDTTYNIALPANTPSYEFTNITVSTDATYTVDSNKNLTNNSRNERKIIVKSQSGVDNTYYFNMYVASTECEITSIRVLSTGGTELVDLDNKTLVYSAITDEYTLRVANAVTTIKLEVKYSSTSTLKYVYGSENDTYTGGVKTITISLDNVGSTTPNEIMVQALSQLFMLNNDLGASSVSDEYKIKIIREELDDDNTLSILQVYTGSSDLINGFQSTNFGPYPVGDLGLTTANINLVAETTSPKAKIISISTVPSSAVGKNKFTGMISLDSILSTTLTSTIVVTVQAENGTTQDYQIIVARGKIEADEDNTVADIKVTDNVISPKSHIEFVSTTTAYEVTIPVGVSNYEIIAEKINGSLATLYITSENGNVLSAYGKYTVTIDQSLWGKTVKYYVYAMAQDTTIGKGTQYEIAVTVAKPSDDNKLDSLKVDGQELITSTNIEGPYVLGVPFETSSITLFAESAHEKATIKVGATKVVNIFSDSINLKVGVNPIIVEVYAEDGISIKEYKIEITRAAEAPKLDTLEVNGHPLRDTLGNRVIFDPEVYEYQVLVPYVTNEVEIIASSTQGTVHGTGTKSINVGPNNFSVQVVANDGMSTQYKVNVIRLERSYSDSTAKSIKIAEIKQFDNEFHSLKTSGYEYTVPNNIKNLTVTVELTFEDDNINDDLAASYVIYGDKNLHVGLNNIVVICTSADGTSKTTYVIQVTREPKQYEVNNKDEAVKSYELTQNKDTNGNDILNEYTVDIGDKKTSDVDFAKFIENLNPNNQDLEIEVLTDVSTNPDEVVVRVSDGDQTEFVKFQVKSTGNPTGFQGQEWTFLLLLGVILIVLLAILVTVNKDKYGKITKKTNRKNERKEKKEDAKRK